jgi:hypothetical protein
MIYMSYMVHTDAERRHRHWLVCLVNVNFHATLFKTALYELICMSYMVQKKYVLKRTEELFLSWFILLT